MHFSVCFSKQKEMTWFCSLLFSLFLLPRLLAEEQFSLVPSSSDVVNQGHVCPGGRVTFTCTARELTDTSNVYWYINNDQVSTFMLSDFASYPQGVNTSRPGVTVTVDSMQGGVAVTNLTLVLSQQKPRSVSCGTRSNKTSASILCSLQPAVSFLEAPMDQECYVNGSAMFRCQPAPSLPVTVLWVVNGSSNLDAFPGFTTSRTLTELQVTSCQPEWSGTRVQCVLATPTQTFIMPTYARLVVNQKQSAEEQLQAFVTRYWVWFFILFLVAVCMCAVAVCCAGVCCCCCVSSRKRKARMPVSTEPHSGYHIFKEDSEVFRPRRKPRTPSEAREQDRRSQEHRERTDALQAVKVFFPNAQPLPDLGSRLKKYWFKQEDMIVTHAPVPVNCKLMIDKLGVHVHKLNKLLNEISAHDQAAVLLCNMKVYAAENNEVIVTQPFKKSSLRDIIYKNEDVLKDWAEKYDCGGPLPLEQVSLYGRKILKAIQVLYDMGFPSLGHIQPGNIFIDGDVCQVGGYENTLLGYKSRLYRKIAEGNCLEDIDVVMFGHVMYEMSAGKELKELFPSDEEYDLVQEVKCKEAIQYIFTRKEGRFKHSIEKISAHGFFQQSSSPSVESQDVLELIGGVRVPPSQATAVGGGARSMAGGMINKAKAWLRPSWKKQGDRTPLVELA